MVVIFRSAKPVEPILWGGILNSRRFYDDNDLIPISSKMLLLDVDYMKEEKGLVDLSFKTNLKKKSDDFNILTLPVLNLNDLNSVLEDIYKDRHTPFENSNLNIHNWGDMVIQTINVINFIMKLYSKQNGKN